MDSLQLFISVVAVLSTVLTLVFSVTVFGTVVIVESNVVKSKVVIEVSVERTVGGIIEDIEGGGIEDVGGGAIEGSIDEIDMSVVSTVFVIFDEISDEVPDDVSTGAAVVLVALVVIVSVEINLVVLNVTLDLVSIVIFIAVEVAIDVDCLVLLIHFGVVIGAIVDDRISEYLGISDRVEDVVLVSSETVVPSHIVVDSVDVVDGSVAALVVVSATVVSVVVYSGVVDVV
jgi:hypothetical protein